jgi:hypothetical protein
MAEEFRVAGHEPGCGTDDPTHIHRQMAPAKTGALSPWWPHVPAARWAATVHIDFRTL